MVKGARGFYRKHGKGIFSRKGRYLGGGAELKEKGELPGGGEESGGN